MLWVLNLFTSVLATLLLLLLVRSAADRLEPASGPQRGRGRPRRPDLPFATLFFSHALSTALVFAGFAVLFGRSPRPRRVAAAGSARGPLRSRRALGLDRGGCSRPLRDRPDTRAVVRPRSSRRAASSSIAAVRLQHLGFRQSASHRRTRTTGANTPISTRRRSRVGRDFPGALLLARPPDACARPRRRPRRLCAALSPRKPRRGARVLRRAVRWSCTSPGPARSAGLGPPRYLTPIMPVRVAAGGARSASLAAHDAVRPPRSHASRRSP